MDGLAYRLLTADAFEFAAISIVAMVVFAGVAVGLYRPAWTMPRSAYFSALCVCVAAGQLSYLLQYLFLDALKQQQVGQLAFAYVLIWLGIGAITGVISAGRSRDAFGTMWWWPLAFVPFANLTLIFYPSRQARSKGTGRRIANIVLVVCGLALVGLTASLPAPGQDYIDSVSARVETDTDLRDNAMVYAVEHDGLEATLKRMMEGVPLFDNELSRMLSIEVHGDVIVATSEVKDETFDFDDVWRDQSTERLCLSKNQAMLLKMGATLRNVYQSSSGETLSELIINTETCDAWRARREKAFVDDILSMKLPKKVSETVAIVGATYEDRTMTLRYELTEVPPGDAWMAKIKDNMCTEDNFGVMVQLGMTIRSQFAEAKANGSVPIGEIVVDAKSCPADLP
ncbi:hypothetical protein [Pleomorphomonas sp. JP5]|uniref:hypothetical protein n=1 Tax=Pleomorphomonas sp. JP5 TaxID=2942998 RepID=UPI00204378A6|nr:hypothetical protein [Pleomorphomonas sp. JP5]MCM5557124.1 hypothetical protein [Pleomorphomonas sp. JP5]